jgi:hypothetical protein
VSHPKRNTFAIYLRIWILDVCNKHGGAGNNNSCWRKKAQLPGELRAKYVRPVSRKSGPAVDVHVQLRDLVLFPRFKALEFNITRSRKYMSPKLK